MEREGERTNSTFLIITKLLSFYIVILLLVFSIFGLFIGFESSSRFSNLTDVDCSLGFDREDFDFSCCGLVATGSVVKDGRSIFWKQRHYNDSDNKPAFYTGVNYSYYMVAWKNMGMKVDDHNISFLLDINFLINYLLKLYFLWVRLQSRLTIKEDLTKDHSWS